MFGSHQPPFKIENEDIIVETKTKDDLITYEMRTGNKKSSRMILSSDAKILINPIEPVNTPKNITDKLLIKFSETIEIGPSSTRRIYLTFPIEIGIFVMGKRNTEIIDVFSSSKQKYTLYGDVRNGVICKYWESPVLLETKKTDMYKEGIIELFIINPTTRWTEVSQIVFSAHGMKLYYDKEKVMMQARMKILTKESAETEFLDFPPDNDMKKAIEVYTDKVLNILSTKFVMEAGL